MHARSPRCVGCCTDIRDAVRSIETNLRGAVRARDPELRFAGAVRSRLIRAHERDPLRVGTPRWIRHDLVGRVSVDDLLRVRESRCCAERDVRCPKRGGCEVETIAGGANSKRDLLFIGRPSGMARKAGGAGERELRELRVVVVRAENETVGAVEAPCRSRCRRLPKDSRRR
jgi:hypothetical protein